MTPPTSASPRKREPTMDDATDAKLRFLSAAHAASPLRAVEKYPWTAVGVTATAALGLTVISSSPIFKFATSGLLTQGLSIAASLLKSGLSNSLAKGLNPTAHHTDNGATTQS